MPDKDPIKLGEETMEDILEGVPESEITEKSLIRKNK